MTDLGLEEPPVDVCEEILFGQANDLVNLHLHLNALLENRIEELLKERESTRVSKRAYRCNL